MQVIYNSLSGNTQQIAQRIAEHFNATCESYKDAGLIADCIFLGTYTTGNGKIPPVLKDWVTRQNWTNRHVVLFGSGNTMYPRFCGALDGLCVILNDMGAHVVQIVRVEHSHLESAILENIPNEKEMRHGKKDD